MHLDPLVTNIVASNHSFFRVGEAVLAVIVVDRLLNLVGPKHLVRRPVNTVSYPNLDVACVRRVHQRPRGQPGHRQAFVSEPGRLEGATTQKRCLFYAGPPRPHHSSGTSSTTGLIFANFGRDFGQRPYAEGRQAVAVPTARLYLQHGQLQQFLPLLLQLQ